MGDRQQDMVNLPQSALGSHYLYEKEEESKHRNMGFGYMAVVLSEIP